MTILAAAALLVRMVLCAGVCFAAGYWVIVAWMSRRLSATEGGTLLIGVVVFMFVGVRIALLASTGAFVCLILVLGAAVTGLYAYSGVVNRRAHERFDEEDIATYQAALDLDPHNAAAHSFLAKTYRRQGRLGEALAEYEAALKLDPSLQEERYWVARLRRELEDAAGRETECRHCGAIGPPIEGRCQGCGRPLPKGGGGEI